MRHALRYHGAFERNFEGLKPGARVIDMFGGNHYWAEIMAPVVGPKGKVVVWEPTQFLDDNGRKSFTDFAKGHKNVSLISSPFEAPALPANAFDFMIMNLDYHDVYWESAEYKVVRMDPDAWLKTLYAAIRPGGTVGIIDHVALPNGDTRATVDKLHRIYPEVAKLADALLTRRLHRLRFHTSVLGPHINRTPRNGVRSSLSAPATRPPSRDRTSSALVRRGTLV